MCNLFPRTDRKVKWHLLPNCSAGKIKDLVHSQAQKLLNSTLINSWPLKGCITSVRWGEAQINTQVIYMVRQRSTLLCRRQQQEFLILLLVSQLQKDLLWKILAKNTKNTAIHHWTWPCCPGLCRQLWKQTHFLPNVLIQKPNEHPPSQWQVKVYGYISSRRCQEAPN